MGLILEHMLDPTLVLKRDLEAVSEGIANTKPLVRKKRKKADEPPTHIVIGDLQVKPGVNTRNIDWIGSFIHDEFSDHENVVCIQGGDHWDMPSLSSYDRGKARMENQRVAGDILAGNEAFARLDALIPKKKSWSYHFLFGNHEQRILRAVQDHAQLEGILGWHLLDTKDWQRHDFLEVVWLDGVAYAHYFHPVSSARPYGGGIENRLAKIGHSFTMFHQQGLLHGMRSTIRGMHQGLVLGSSYPHAEAYLGWQGNSHWRGIAICHQVENGEYDPQFLSLDYLARRYEGMRLSEFMERYPT